MGRDFNISGFESTYKPVSYIMHEALTFVLAPRDAVRESGTIYIEDLANVIHNLRFIINSVDVPELDTTDAETFRNNFSYYEKDSFDGVLKNCKTACDILTKCLLQAVMDGTKELYWTYS